MKVRNENDINDEPFGVHKEKILSAKKKILYYKEKVLYYAVLSPPWKYANDKFKPRYYALLWLAPTGLWIKYKKNTNERSGKLDDKCERDSTITKIVPGRAAVRIGGPLSKWTKNKSAVYPFSSWI